MIQGFVEMLDADLGESKATKLSAMTPEKLALAVTDPNARKVAIQCALLLAWADGSLSDKERTRVVEYATALGFSRAAYDGTAMIAIYVAPAHRRQGLGRRLLEEALARAPGVGLHTLLGYIFGHNEPSLRLFAAHGFERWAHLPRVAVLDGVERDLIIVGRRVAP